MSTRKASSTNDGSVLRGSSVSRRTLVANLGGLAAAGLAAPAAAQGQSYPTRRITMIIGFAPGGGSDVTGRVISEALQRRLGQPVVVDNRPGAGSTVAARLVASAPADGYTLMYMSSDGVSLGAALQPALGYDPLGGFAFIARMVGFSYVIAAHPRVPFNSLAGMIEHARRNPNALRYGSSGVGSGPQMAAELIASTAGVKLEHVPFRGAAPAAAATVAGDIEIVVAAPSTVQSLAEAGQLKVLGVTGLERHPNFPTAPTLAESGLPPMEITIWWGVVAPAGTPAPVLRRIETALAEIAADRTVNEQLSRLGFDMIHLDSAAFRQFAAEDIERWTRTARAANIRLE
jgi:tripartite-type tricarboxylate transporter receptor subunit TctC